MSPQSPQSFLVAEIAGGEGREKMRKGFKKKSLPHIFSPLSDF